MGEIALWILFFILIVVALYGSFISKFPSTFLALAAVLIAKFCMQVGEYITWLNLSIIVILTVASMVVTKMAPKWAKTIATYGKGGTWGTIVGSILALLLSVAFATIESESEALAYVLIVLSFIILPFLFAWIFELISQKKMVPALQSAGAATVVYISTSFIKLITVVYAVVLVFFNNN